MTSRPPDADFPGPADPLVLIVDDNELNLKLTRDVLRVAGFRTLEATSGAHGIALAGEHLPHVILMDLRLPDMDGADAARILGEGCANGAHPGRRAELSAARRQPRLARQRRLRRLPREAVQHRRVPGPGPWLLHRGASVSVPAALPRTPEVTIHGTRYPLVLPSWRDPRLHLAAVIVSLQVLGQVAFDFNLSIAQILISVGTCALIEVAIVARRQHMLVWPASALLTGNGVAFILRVPGTEHGDWWSLNGWWIFAGTAAVSLLSKYVIRFRGAHVFNPSNFGLVLCFLLLGPTRADPLDFWWGPLSPALALALAIIVIGGFVILSRLGLLVMAVSFWLVFVAAVALIAATGHAMTAKWHLGPIEGLHLWTVLAFSPEILVFLFFMLTDPKTVPAGPRARVAFGVSVALLAAALVALASTEFWAKVAVLGALAIVCAGAARARCASVDPPRSAEDRRARHGRARGVRRGADRRRRAYPAGSAGGSARRAGGPVAAGRDRTVTRRRLEARPAHGETDRRRPAAATAAGSRASGHPLAGNRAGARCRHRGTAPGPRPAGEDRRGGAVAERIQDRASPAPGLRRHGCLHPVEREAGTVGTCSCSF